MNEQRKIPQCIGIIMDGNRRWAKERGLPTLFGHEKGYGKMKEAVAWAKERGVKNVIIYGFSTENWNRAPGEISYLMDIFRKVIRDDAAYFKKEGVRITVIGTREKLAPDIQEGIADMERETKDCTNVHFVLAISYGGRLEITHAINELIKKGKEVSEEDVSKALWTSGVPDPDIIVRTGGAQRLSNFLPWQSVYSELLFLDKHWPEFTIEDFDIIITEFNERERRFGK